MDNRLAYGQRFEQMIIITNNLMEQISTYLQPEKVIKVTKEIDVYQLCSFTCMIFYRESYCVTQITF